MLTNLRTRLTYSNVMATIAVFAALGGTSYAALQVTGKDVRNSSLTGKDVRNNSLTGKDVKRLTGRDFIAGQLPRGPQGPAGKDGAAGATNVVVRTIEPCPTLPANVHCSMPIQCKTGERAIGGGAGFSNFAGNEVIDASQPLEADGSPAEEGDTPTGWFVANEYTSGGPRNAIGYVICASP